MASVHSMPPDTREREKIVGGVLDFIQLLWLAGGFVICVAITMAFFKSLGFFSLVFGIPFVAAGAVFAFMKKENLPLPKYIKLKMKYNWKTKYYINSGKKTTLEFTVPDSERR